MSGDEYDALVRCAVETSAGRRPVIAGTGSNSTAATIAQTRHAKELGADVALVVVPYYNKPPQASLKAHFEAVADQGGLPVMLYNVPGRTSRNMEVDTILALTEHPNIGAVKEASGDIDQIQRICLGAPDDFWILSGDDALTLPLILLNGHGASVAGSVVQTQQAGTGSSRGDIASADGWQKKLYRSLIFFCDDESYTGEESRRIFGTWLATHPNAATGNYRDVIVNKSSGASRRNRKQLKRLLDRQVEWANDCGSGPRGGRRRSRR